MVSISRKICFPQQEYASPAEICFKNWIAPNLGNGFHQQEKALKSSSKSRNKFPAKFHQEEEVFFKKRLYSSSFLFLLGETKTVKSFSVQMKQYSLFKVFLPVYTIIETMWKPIFKEELHCFYQKLFFWLAKIAFFRLVDIPGFENSIFVKWKRIIQKILHSGQWKWVFCLLDKVSIILFRVLLKFWNFSGENVFMRNLVPARRN